jgi:hypothetical protein
LPFWLFSGFTFTLAGALVFLWLGHIIAIMISGIIPPEPAETGTLQSQVLDLGMVVPLPIGTGVLLFRRLPWGFLLLSISLSFGCMMFITIPVWIIVPLVQDGKRRLPEAGHPPGVFTGDLIVIARTL